ncbi:MULTISPECIES: NAD(P)/FAD-dependent oxidoreductase [unclassified Crossiella]|uniref:NAD(P)/FAD-dependent oxidoreductase n=1 Tax=unclassified Crossiella TaxID=2620835 RepID=UPI001FFEAA4F|nr:MULTISPECIES: enterotoxin [unclassified Crossiella]MCK2239219.1 enterotoxin [Crossiella sp. S99.2]MCK2251212.1 enterotoxin [Crossiella sp. S99.1]
MLQHAAILGGGMGGMLAAFALAPHAEAVTVVEQDGFAGEPVPRRGAPQARHTHALVSGGARAMEALAPGVLAELAAAGAQHINLPGRYLGLASRGWFPRYAGRQFILGCSRELLESTLRGRLRELPNVTVLGRTEVVGLQGSLAGVTGVRTGSGLLAAELVVDATGRRSRAPRWLTELGFPPVRESIVDPGIFYATGVFRAPEDAGPDFPAVTLQSSPRREPGVRRNGTLLPIEDGLWMITLSGGPGSRPGTDAEGFRAFAALLPHPVLAELIEAATPIGTPFGFRADANRRRHFERLRPCPHGFVALGDAYATFNPVYGHGMSAAALSALALRTEFERRRRPGTLSLQRVVAKAAANAWDMATGQDARYPGTNGPAPGMFDGVFDKLGDWISASSGRSRLVTDIRADIFALTAPPSRMRSPRVLWQAVRGGDSGGPVLPDPPFTPAERRVLGARQR